MGTRSTKRKRINKREHSKTVRKGSLDLLSFFFFIYLIILKASCSTLFQNLNNFIIIIIIIILSKRVSRRDQLWLPYLGVTIITPTH
jgi:hypothetical protein